MIINERSHLDKHKRGLMKVNTFKNTKKLLKCVANKLNMSAECPTFYRMFTNKLLFHILCFGSAIKMIIGFFS